MLISEAAQFLSATTGIEVLPGQLIDQLKIKFPGQKWNVNSEVPEAFVEEIEKLATNAQEPKASLQKADPQNLIEAIEVVNFLLLQILQNSMLAQQEPSASQNTQ